MSVVKLMNETTRSCEINVTIIVNFHVIYFVTFFHKHSAADLCQLWFKMLHFCLNKINNFCCTILRCWYKWLTIIYNLNFNDFFVVLFEISQKVSCLLIVNIDHTVILTYNNDSLCYFYWCYCNISFFSFEYLPAIGFVD